MGLLDFIKGELIEVVEWRDPAADVLVWRFPSADAEIKNGAQLVVRPGQAAVFVDQGRAADVFTPGRYELATSNLPVLSRLRGWKHGFESPFKADVYFVSTRQVVDQKWGTRNPVMLRDPEFGPVRVRAFGTYAMRVAEPAKLIVEVAGTDSHFSVDGVRDQLRNLIVSRFSDAVAERRLPVLDLAASYDELGRQLHDRVAPEFAGYGLELTTLLVENVSLPEAVEKALDKRSSMGVIGDLDRYTRYQTAESIEKAAENPGGGAGEGMGMGMGFAMGARMGETLAGQGPAASAGPPPLPGHEPAAWHVAVDGEATGPHAVETLRGLAASGRLERETLVWKQGMEGWTRAGAVPELSGVFPASPPPLPGE